MTQPNTQDQKAVACPFCGGPAKTFPMNGAQQAGCSGAYKECAGTDVMAPVAMWNRRAQTVTGSGEREAEAINAALDQARRGADKAGCDGWRAQEMCRQIVQLLEPVAALRGDQT